MCPILAAGTSDLPIARRLLCNLLKACAVHSSIWEARFHGQGHFVFRELHRVAMLTLPVSNQIPEAPRS